MEPSARDVLAGITIAFQDAPELMAAIAQAILKHSVDTRIPVPAIRFSIASMTDVEARLLFRFTYAEIKRMIVCFQLPDIVTAQNVRVSSLEAVCFLMRRLSYPCRLKVLTREFGRHHTVLSSLVNTTVHELHDRYQTRLVFDDKMIVLCANASALAISESSGCLECCIGFIDGTVRPICRPKVYQRQCYNGHKRVHSIKFQSVSMANGLIVSMYGPIEGRRHDVALLRGSMIGARMRDHCPGFYLYGDPAYPLSKWLLSPFKNAAPNTREAEFNKRMGSVRVTVEWCFGSLVNQWAFLDFKKQHKVFLSPIAKYYLVGTLLSNCITCLRGNETSQFFKCMPPTLEEYLTA